MNASRRNQGATGGQAAQHLGFFRIPSHFIALFSLMIKKVRCLEIAQSKDGDAVKWEIKIFP